MEVPRPTVGLKKMAQLVQQAEVPVVFAPREVQAQILINVIGVDLNDAVLAGVAPVCLRGQHVEINMTVRRPAGELCIVGVSSLEVIDPLLQTCAAQNI